MDAQAILKRFAKAENERRRLETIFDDAIRLTMPTRKRFHNTDINEAAEDIFDETGANAVSEFNSRMQAGLFPPFVPFVQLQASQSVDPKDRAAVNRDLEIIQEYLFEEIWASNFAQESAEFLNDVAISTGLMSLEEGYGSQALHNRAVPITDFYLENAADDRLGGQYRKREIPADELMKLYPDAEISRELATMIKGENDKPLTVIEYLKRDPFAAIEKSKHCIVVKECNEVIQEKNFSGVGSTPLIPARWATASGETWGRGPLLNALAAIRTTNLTVELILENAAMSIVGIYQTDNDATINADQVTLLPGTILAKEWNSEGLQPVNTSGGSFDVSSLVLQDQRLNIKRALFNDMLSDPNKTPATATEVAERMADLAHRTSAGFARMFYEFVVPYIHRALYILEKRGDIELPVKNGRALQFHATSPLAQAQQGREVQRLLQEWQLRAAMYGPQIATASFKPEELDGWLRKRFGLDDRLYAGPKKVKEAIESAGQAMMQMQAAQGGQNGPAQG